MQWEYIDSKGDKQGPFGEDELAEWCAAGYFTSKNLVRCCSDHSQEFLPIALIRPTFAKNILQEVPNSGEWYVFDNECRAEGPFSLEVLKGWLLRGDLGPDAFISHSGDRFKKLREFDHFKELFDFIEKEWGPFWYYKDAKGDILGPFDVDQMRENVETGEFFEETLVGKLESLQDQKLEETNFFEVGDLETANDRLFQIVEDSNECFYVGSKGQIVGPVLFAQICNWAEEGKLIRHALVCFKGEKFFTPLCKHPRFDFIKEQDASLHEEKGSNEYTEESSKDKALPTTIWYYVDDDSITQGPFSSSDMVSWIHAGYLKPSRQVSNSSEGPFVELKSVMKNLNDSALEERNRSKMSGSNTGKPEEPKVWWYLNCEMEVHGPYGVSDMKRLGLSGVLSKELFKYKCSASKDGNQSKMLRNWMPIAASLLHLFPFASVISDQWDYIDQEGNQQGPFPTSMMRSWYIQGFFNPEHLQVKTTKEKQFKLVSQRSKPAFMSIPVPSSATPSVPALSHIIDPVTFKMQATFNKNTGRFETIGNTGTHWARQGLPEDAEGRQMSRFFNIDAWHEERNLEDSSRDKKRKKTNVQ